MVPQTRLLRQYVEQRLTSLPINAIIRTFNISKGVNMKNLLLISLYALTALTIFSASAASLKTVSPADAAVVPTLTDPQKSFVTMPLDERREKFRDKDWDAYRNHRIGFVFQNYN